MIDDLIEIAQQAGQLILAVYQQSDLGISRKQDNSHLTEADTKSHVFICEALSRLYPAIPIISEESPTQQPYEIRKDWEYCFLVDPLDGTREFIRRNGEFTVNIALVKNHQPVLGVIHVPVLDVTYYAEKGQGAFKIEKGEHIRLLQQAKPGNDVRVIVSRARLSTQTEKFLTDLKKSGKTIKTLSAGSALKFGVIAEGGADAYPRFSPTMEWDTAPGQIILNEVGKRLRVHGSSEELSYNKADLLNPSFIIDL